MKRYTCGLLLLCCLCVHAEAIDAPAGFLRPPPVHVEAVPPDSFDAVNTEGPVRSEVLRPDDFLFDDVPVVLTPKEQYAMGLVQPWQDQTEIGVNPMAAPGGAVQFAYGMERPSVLCAVLQITDVELQAGEIIQSVNIGDSARWIVEPAMSGANIPHLLIKPMDVGLETSLAVATDRRMYHFRLRSTRNEYMARITFTYPADAARQFAELKAEAEAKRRQEIERDTIPETNEYLGDLDFNYTITGKAAWKPTRVYNDGVKTVIEMPETVSQDDSPTLLVLRKRAGLFRKDEEVLVNYRVQRNRYVVDAVFDKAMLVVGVGRGQTRVIIERDHSEGGGQ